MYQFIPLTNHYWHVISCNLVILALTLSIVWVKICFVISVSNYDSILINTVEWTVILVNCEQTDGRTTWWRTFIDHLTRQAYKANDSTLLFGMSYKMILSITNLSNLQMQTFLGLLTGKYLFHDHGHKSVHTVWQQTDEISCSGQPSNVGKFMLRTLKRIQNTSELTGFTVNRPNGQISVSLCLVLSTVRVKEHCHHHQMKRRITT